MSAENVSSVDRWSKIAALVATIATVFSAYNAIKVSSLEADFKQVEAERELNFRIYSSIADALESGDEKRVLAVRGIVQAMASESIRPAFLQALEPAMQRVFAQEELEVASSTIAQKGNASIEPKSITTDGSWGEWDFDVFWCASSGIEAENISSKIVHGLINAGAKGRIRSRILPDTVNQRRGYQVTGFQIRRSDNEIEMANKLNKFVTSLPDLENITIKEKLTSQKTAWYISIFVCPMDD
ncbi:MAG: hypothetical protein ACI808_000168 [Paraglaciecola sp.]|jgi:hypothetical protein